MLLLKRSSFLLITLLIHLLIHVRHWRIVRGVTVEWDPAKNRVNIRKHGVSFEEASELFELDDDRILEVYDFEHSLDEDRLISIGPIRRGTIVVVSVERDQGSVLRLISARFASNAEEQRYSQAIGGV